jgi:importin-7
MEERVVQALTQCLSADIATRQAGEAYLEAAKSQPGFTVLLLSLSLAPSLDLNLRQLSVIMLKNLTAKWKKAAISPADKQSLTNSILNCLLFSVPVKIRLQFEEISQVIGKYEYPWPGINEALGNYLNSQNPDLIFAALTFIVRTIKNFEFVIGEKREKLKILVSNFLQTLQTLAFGFLSESSGERFAYLGLISQTFWSAFYIDMQTDQITSENMERWLRVFLQIFDVAYDVGFPADASEAEQKKLDSKLVCKKWASQILHRFFSRYHDINNLSDNNKTIGVLVGQFSGLILTGFVNQVFQYGKVYIPELVMNYSFKYLNEAIKWPATCEMLKNMQTADGRAVLAALITDVIIPVMCKSAADEELWQDNAIEFIRREADISRAFYSPACAAGDVLETMCKQGYLQQFLDYLSSSLLLSPVPLLKEALINAVGTLSSVLLDHASLSGRVEAMLQAHVFQDLASPVGFLRARACWAYGRFAAFSFTDPAHQQAALEAVCRLLIDPDLPVRYQAALTVPKILVWKIAKERVAGEISNLLQIYLKMVNEVDSEEIIEALEDVVENFEAEVKPFAVELIGQLVGTFGRLAGREVADDNGDSAMAAVSTLNTIVRLLGTVEDSKEEIAKIGVVIAPVLQHCLSKNGFEYMEEALKILSILLFNAENGEMSHLYGFFSLILQSINPVDPFAIEKVQEMHAPIANFIAKFPEQVSNEVENLISFCIQLLTLTSKTQDLAIKIIITLIERIKVKMIPLLPKILPQIWQSLGTDVSTKIKVLSCSLFYVAIWADPSALPLFLDSSGVLLQIINFSIQNAKSFKEKLPRIRMIAGLSALLPIMQGLQTTFDEGKAVEMFGLLMKMIILAEEDESGEEEDLDEKEPDYDDKCQELYRKIKENIENSDDEGDIFDTGAEEYYDSPFESFEFREYFKEMIEKTGKEIVARLENSLEFEQKAIFNRLIR